MATKTKTCNICTKSAREVGPLVQGGPEGNFIYLCPNCIQACMVKVQETERRRASNDVKQHKAPSPRLFYNHLNNFVIGQDVAKRRISVAVTNHYKRLADENNRQLSVSPSAKHPELAATVIQKSNMLLLGPTGSGKTLIAKSLAEALGVPFAIGDATTLTEAGYVGEDVENLLLKLLHAADFDIELAERGIIYIDEIDKLHKTGHNVSITRDVSGEGVQQSLLKMIEGTVSNIPPQGGRKHPEQQYIQMDTTNILFICGGSFVGLEEIIAKRIGKRAIGFGREMVDHERNNLLRQVTQDDLIQFGLIPELVGRLPVLAPLDELTKEDLIRVLTQPRDAILKQYQKLFWYDGVELIFTDEAVEEIATIAKAKGTGARALRSVVEDFMNDITFELPDGDKTGMCVMVTPEVVRREQHFVLTQKDEAA